MRVIIFTGLVGNMQDIQENKLHKPSENRFLSS